MNKWNVYKTVAKRPIDATTMLYNHRRTLKYLWKKDRRSFWNHIFVTYLVRGEDCGKGVLDPLWKLTGRAPFLWDLEMETTTACYLKCIHCEHTYFDKSYLNQHLSYTTFREVVDSVPSLKWVNLTGEGTSILNPAFKEMVWYAKRTKGVYLDLSHDFVKLDDETALTWVKAGVDRIYWSLDGCTKETYEKVRVGASFDKVIENVRKLVACKKELNSPLPEICFRFTFFRDNVHEVPALPDFLASLVKGVKDYGDEPSINIVALLEFEETRGWEREIDEATVELVNERAKRLGFKVYWSHVTHVEEEKAPMDYCTFWSEPYIMITGHVVPCCAVLMSNNRPRLEELSFGNIHEQPLKEIWDTGYYREFRKTVVNPRAPVPKVCLGCRAFNTQTRARRFGIWQERC